MSQLMSVSGLKTCVDCLESGKPLSALLDGDGSVLSSGDQQKVRSLDFLTAKPMIYLCNTDEDAVTAGDQPDATSEEPETVTATPTATATSAWQSSVREWRLHAGNKHTRAVADFAQRQAVQRPCVMACARLENELLGASTPEERDELLSMVGLSPGQTGLPQLVKLSAELLGLSHFYTVGPTESRSWLINKGCSAQEAASKIHSDIARGLIRVEVMKPLDFLSAGSETVLRQQGRLAIEAKDYTVQTGDILHFKFSA